MNGTQDWRERLARYEARLRIEYKNPQVALCEVYGDSLDHAYLAEALAADLRAVLAAASSQEGGDGLGECSRCGSRYGGGADWWRQAAPDLALVCGDCIHTDEKGTTHAPAKGTTPLFGNVDADPRELAEVTRQRDALLARLAEATGGRCCDEHPECVHMLAMLEEI